MKLIPLTCGKFAKVDDEDFEYLNKFKWHYDGRYARRCIGYKTMMMHREILGLKDKNIFCDHKDRDKLNNQRSNLRTATPSQNQYNKSASGISNYIGVCFEPDRNKWRASIMKDDIHYRSPRFNAEIEAAKWRDKMANELHGEFANLNFNQ